MDRLSAMRVFAKVIDEGSFAGAARSFNWSPAVVTRLVAELEAHLGTRLMNRTTRRIALTEAGEKYLDRVRSILADLDDAEAQAGATSSEPRGQVRVLSPPAFSAHQLAMHLPEFRRRYPHVNVELVATGPVDTVDERFDITIIASTNELSGDFVARALAVSEVVVCASPAYLDRSGRPTTPSELGEHEVLIPPTVRELSFFKTKPNHAATVREAVRVSSLRPALSTSHVDTLHSAALAGLGIAGLPSFVVASSIRSKTLERVLPGWHMMTSTIYAAIPTRKHVPARTRALLDFLVELFGGKGPDQDPWLSSCQGG